MFQTGRIGAKPAGMTLLNQAGFLGQAYNQPRVNPYAPPPVPPTLYNNRNIGPALARFAGPMPAVQAPIRKPTAMPMVQAPMRKPAPIPAQMQTQYAADLQRFGTPNQTQMAQAMANPTIQAQMKQAQSWPSAPMGKPPTQASPASIQASQAYMQRQLFRR